MKDYLVRGLVNSKNCRVFACQTTNLLEKARQEHDLWPTASAALGRMMSATLMMAAMNKNNEKMKLQRSISFIKSKETIILNLSTNIRKIAKKILPINRNAIRHFVRFFAFIT